MDQRHPLIHARAGVHRIGDRLRGFTDDRRDSASITSVVQTVPQQLAANARRLEFGQHVQRVQVPEAAPCCGDTKANRLSAAFGDPEAITIVFERVLAECHGPRAPRDGVFERPALRTGAQIVGRAPEQRVGRREVRWTDG